MYWEFPDTSQSQRRPKIGPQVKPMPDFGIFVGAMMGKNIVLELPEPCRGDLSQFSKNYRIICLDTIVKNAPNRVDVRDLGLILWENYATPLINIFRPVLGQRMSKIIQKNQTYA